MKLNHAFFCLLMVFVSFNLNSQSHKIVESNSQFITIEFDFHGKYELKDTLIESQRFYYVVGNEISYRTPGEPWIPQYGITLGIPFSSEPRIEILQINQKKIGNFSVLPYPDNNSYFGTFDLEARDKDIYSTNRLFPSSQIEKVQPFEMRFSKIQPLYVAPYQYNPVTRELYYNSKIVLRFHYNEGANNEVSVARINDNMTNEFLKTSVVNYELAKQWIGKKDSQLASSESVYWYSPNKDWYKIYIKDKGLYRITYSEFVSKGVQFPPNVHIKNLEIFNNGLKIPLEIFDNNKDNLFNSGDFVNFIGYKPTKTIYNNSNIYNVSNVYWFSYEGDTSAALRFSYKNAEPNFYHMTIQENYRTDLYEVDSLFERLGYAVDDKRDYWYWGTISGQSNTVVSGFRMLFEPFKRYEAIPGFYNPNVLLRVNMHGMTDFSCNYAHKVKIYVNNKFIGTALWNRQEAFTFEKYFYVSADSIPIYSDGNYIRVETDGDICHPSKSDVVKVNWFDFTYYSRNLVGGNYVDYKPRPSALGLVRHWLWEWTADTMIVYVPGKNTILTHAKVLRDFDKNAFFVDSVDRVYEYFCVVPEYFRTIDSIRRDVASSLRALTNGADYIIITHPKFKSVANRLAALRSTNFPDNAINSPRIFIADINDIYDEFSHGLLDPYAAQKFVKYAFENWRNPAPSYVVLLGDMSYDYRKRSSTSRESFIPSIPYHSYTYGQAASDNAIVCVVGDDVVPDLSIGRLSVETVAEGNILLDKLEQYPADNSKKWKETVLLMSSGLDGPDELRFGFNDASSFLNSEYLIKNGFDSKMIMRYPNKPEHFLHQGSTAEIRKAFNEGTIVANYYGHGGSSQWDLTFLSDDIYLLQNGGRLPVILSVTCYTAHFDNQDVFGEIFNKVPGKGSIGFFGSSGLTHWEIGKYINHLFFDEMFHNRNTIIGKSILNAKGRVISPYGYYGNQIALLTYLGDPVLKVALPTTVDFIVKRSNIKIAPENPLVNDSVVVKVAIDNFGIFSPNDTVSVELFFASSDTSGSIAKKRIKSFANRDSIEFFWKPQLSGLYDITVKVNLTDNIIEDDLSDNTASVSLAVFNISEPNIIAPKDGYSTSTNSIRFVVSDIGYYVNKQFEYYIEIDTSIAFSNPVKSPKLSPGNGMLLWNSPVLQNGAYYWRTRIADGEELGRWSITRTFLVSPQAQPGYYVADKQLNLFEKENVYFSTQANALVLNTNLQPPKPSQAKWTQDIDVTHPPTDTVGLSCLTTDGKYLYVGQMWYFVQQYNPTSKSRIYRIGTGNEGTVAGNFYGEVPNFYDRITNQIFYHGDGFIYVPYGDANRLIKINPNSAVNNIDTVFIHDGLLKWDTGVVGNGEYYITSDSAYVYNLALKDSNGQYKYSLRVFDPANNWQVVQNYYYENLNSYLGLTGFFVTGGYFYPYENYYSGFMRRIKIADGYFDADWFTWNPTQFSAVIKFYAWTYDWKNDVVYASNFRFGNDIPRKISKFVGSYVDAKGKITSPPIGPAFEWKTLKYNIINNSANGEYSSLLEGLNRQTRKWDSLAFNPPTNHNISSVKAKDYNYLRVSFELVDSSLSTVNPIELRNVNVDYLSPPELQVIKDDLRFSPDSLLQGFDLNMNLKVFNYGEGKADSSTVNFYMDNSDSSFYTATVNIPADSFVNISHIIPTSRLLFSHPVKAIAKSTGNEFYTFNNITSKSFFVSRDSIAPVFKILVDGKEIINGDLVSKKPNIRISLRDNGPLPLDTALFTILYNNIPLSFKTNNLTYHYTGYPNSEAVINWNPTLKQGRHTLDILAKDASGNFFDSTFNRTFFFVYDEDDIANIYNYPNPYKNNTHFTFELRGANTPDEIKFKVYTISGRLIKDQTVLPDQYSIGFNKIFWDGKDQDGDEIANGTYLVKVIAKFKEKTKTEILKVAKVR